MPNRPLARETTNRGVDPVTWSNPLRLLIVDDSPADVELIVAVLRRVGYRFVYEAASSLARFREELARPYDCILSDHNLQDGTGLDVLDALRAAGRDVPFIAVTGILGDEAAVEYIKRGAADYVLKHRLERLPVAVEHARAEWRHREEAVRLQEALRRARQDWEITFDNVPDAVLVFDEESRLRRANRAAAGLFGRRLERANEGDGPFCHSVMAELGALPQPCPHRQALETGKVLRFDMQLSGEDRVFDTIVAPLQVAGGVMQGTVHVMRDITEARRNESALRASEERYRELFENAPYGIYRTGPAGIVLDANPALLAMLGYDSKEQILGSSMAENYDDPGERERLAREHPLGLRGVEVRWKHRSGRLMRVRLSGRAVPAEKGAGAGYEVMAEDVTEWRAVEEQFRHAQKMEAVGRLAGGVAHDFNNLLTVIKGYAELMLDQLAPGTILRKPVEEISRAAGHAAALTRQLLAFSRRQVLQPQVLELDRVIADAEKMLRRLIGEDIELAASYNAAEARVRVDPGQIEQVVMNLAVNARDAMPDGGRLTIETSLIDVDHVYARRHMNMAPGSYVMLAISDTGCGMDAETQAHIFEPFFTTKDKTKGTGLGLATVYGIVQQSGGFIWFYSEPGAGTTFKIHFPCLTGEDAGGWVAAAPAEEPLGGSETVLVVEDDDMVRALAREVLTRQGYRVLVAGAAPQASELALRETRVDLLLTDVVMPGGDGRELAAQLAAAHPEMRLIFMSGYSENSVVRNGVLNVGAEYLQKPFTAHALASKVRTVLDAPLPAGARRGGGR